MDCREQVSSVSHEEAAPLTNKACSGAIVAKILAGTWRQLSPTLGLSREALEPVLPLLITSGAGALAWRRLRCSGLPSRGAFHALRETYIRYALDAIAHERQVADAFRLLRSARVEPILLKGWAIGRVYPESGLRPSGDIDLLVEPAQRTRAESAIDAQPWRFQLDFQHGSVSRFVGLKFDELRDRSELMYLDGTSVRVLGPEDHLRVLCLHLLTHGAWRPLWLCDVAAALEAHPANFDWDRCLGKTKRHANWVLCTIALANLLLGAEIRDTPAREKTRSLPNWFVLSVLRQWGRVPAQLPSFADEVRKNTIMATMRSVVQRWPNPIQATIDGNGRFDNTPRLPLQLKNCAVRTAKLAFSYGHATRETDRQGSHGAETRGSTQCPE